MQGGACSISIASRVRIWFVLCSISYCQNLRRVDLIVSAKDQSGVWYTRYKNESSTIRSAGQLHDNSL